MAIRSPFKHTASLTSDTQPLKPVLPVAQLNIFLASQPAATEIEADLPAYSAYEIDRSKSETLVDQAETLLSRTRKPSGIIDVPVSILDTFELTVAAIDKVMSVSVGHAGFGSAIVRTEAAVHGYHEVLATCEATMGEDVTKSATAEAVVTTFETALTVSATANAMVTANTYEIVDFRWARDGASASWYPSGYTGFYVDDEDKLILAFRVRLNPEVALEGGGLDWYLYYSVNGQAWSVINDFSSNVIGYAMPEFPMPAALTPPLFVTSPGGDRPPEIEGYLIESPSIMSFDPVASSSAARELEIWVPLQITEDAIDEANGKEGTIFFRLVPYASDPGLGFHGVTDTYRDALKKPWLTNLRP